MNAEDILKQAKKAIDEARDVDALEGVRILFLGRKGHLTEILRSLKNKSIEERKRIGEAANHAKEKIEFFLKEKLQSFTEHSGSSRVDVTKPGKKMLRGHMHPLSRIEEEIRNIFISMNFSVVEGPEVEEEKYNFDFLNIPTNHPARDMWDTFWIKKGTLLRTHTSPVQIRYMESHNPPFQIIVPGRVFRYEATDASHEINFYQLEGLVVGRDVSLANFKFVVEEFFKKLFGKEKVLFRFRPSYFPFVEPGVEVDIKLKNGSWLEVMGAGMVHRNVFDAVRYNPEEVQGFAFGVGIDRLAMIKYHIPDIRLFYSGDLRFIKQF